MVERNTALLPMSRYLRQIQMSELGPEGQEKLASAKVVIVGAGGLGHPAISYLAAAGIGELHIVDHDQIELSNLHRQPLFDEQSIGQSKAQIVAQKAKSQNSEINIVSHQTQLDSGNAGALCVGADVVVDAADQFAATYILSDFCRDQKIPLVSASVLRFEAYVGAFCGGVAPSVRAVFPQLPTSAQNCATAGVSGPAVGAMGCLQAQMVLNIVLGLDPSPLGQMFRGDFKSFEFSKFSFLGAPEPNEGFEFVSVFDIGKGDRVIDLRTIMEAVDPILPSAERYLLDDFDRVAVLDVPTILCCRTGLRAWNGALHLQARGQKNICLVAVG